MMKYEELQQHWVRQWIAMDPGNETPEELGRAFVAFVDVAVQIQQMSDLTSEQVDELSADTIQRLNNPVTLGPEHSIAEAVLRRLTADPAGAVRYLEQHISSRSVLQSRRAIAERPSRRRSITRFIEDSLEDRPDAKQGEILNDIKKMKDEFLVTDTEIRGKFDNDVVTLDTFPSRVSTARKRISRRG